MPTIRTTKEKLVNALNFLKLKIKVTPKRAYKIPCKITITKNNVFFEVPEANYSLKCRTKGTGSFSVPFLVFHTLIGNLDETKIVLEITDTHLEIDALSLAINKNYTTVG